MTARGTAGGTPGGGTAGTGATAAPVRVTKVPKAGDVTAAAQPPGASAAVTDAERAWLRQAVRCATDNVFRGGGPFAAYVLRDAEAVGGGVNRVTRDLDPTAHAEVVAIRDACRRLGTFALTGCVLVTSCEPCPLCLAAALWSRVDKVIYAADRYDAARAGFDDLAFHEQLSTSRDRCPLAVLANAFPGSAAPFDAWLAKADRVRY